MGTEVFKRRKEVEKFISFVGNGKVNVVRDSMYIEITSFDMDYFSFNRF